MVGWCPRVQDGCLTELISSCSELRKLFLTANRGVTDEELQAIARHCPKLEQLDLLGHRCITAYGVGLVLESCKNMVFLDVSYCACLDNKSLSKLIQQFPHCAIKHPLPAVSG